MIDAATDCSRATSWTFDAIPRSTRTASLQGEKCRKDQQTHENQGHTTATYPVSRLLYLKTSMAGVMLTYCLEAPEVWMISRSVKVKLAELNHRCWAVPLSSVATSILSVSYNLLPGPENPSIRDVWIYTLSPTRWNCSLLEEYEAL